MGTFDILDCVLWGLIVYIAAVWFFQATLGTRDFIQSQIIYLFFCIIGGCFDYLLSSMYSVTYSKTLSFFSVSWGVISTLTLCWFLHTQRMKRSWQTVMLVRPLLMMFIYKFSAHSWNHYGGVFS